MVKINVLLVIHRLQRYSLTSIGFVKKRYIKYLDYNTNFSPCYIFLTKNAQEKKENYLITFQSTNFIMLPLRKYRANFIQDPCLFWAALLPCSSLFCRQRRLSFFKKESANFQKSALFLNDTFLSFIIQLFEYFFNKH